RCRLGCHAQRPVRVRRRDRSAGLDDHAAQGRYRRVGPHGRSRRDRVVVVNGAFRLGVVAAATARADEPGPGPGAGPEWLSVTRTTNQSSPTQVVAMPATVAAGDLLLMIVALGNDTTFASGTPPSGWTLVGGVGQSGTSRVYVLYRIASGTEGGTTLNIE